MPETTPPYVPGAYLTVEDAAKVLHLHPESLRRIARMKKINFGRAGKRLVFTKDQLDAYVYSNGSPAMQRKYGRHS